MTLFLYYFLFQVSNIIFCVLSAFWSKTTDQNYWQKIKSQMVALHSASANEVLSSLEDGTGWHRMKHWDSNSVPLSKSLITAGQPVHVSCILVISGFHAIYTILYLTILYYTIHFDYTFNPIVHFNFIIWSDHNNF